MKGEYLFSYLTFHAIDKSHRIWLNHKTRWIVWLPVQIPKKHVRFYDPLNLPLLERLFAGKYQKTCTRFNHFTWRMSIWGLECKQYIRNLGLTSGTLHLSHFWTKKTTKHLNKYPAGLSEARGIGIRKPQVNSSTVQLHSKRLLAETKIMWTSSKEEQHEKKHDL